MTSTLGYSKRSTFTDPIVRVNHTLKVDNLEAKHTNIEAKPTEDIEVHHEDKENTK